MPNCGIVVAPLLPILQRASGCPQWKGRDRWDTSRCRDGGDPQDGQGWATWTAQGSAGRILGGRDAGGVGFACANEPETSLSAARIRRAHVRDSILKAIARDVNGKSSAKHGRPGLSYWEILVLAAARLGCGYDYDQLQDLAENHRALRQVMGIGD